MELNESSNIGTEIKGEKYPIHFEPGAHIFLDRQVDELFKGFESGDLSANFWINGSQIAKRMREYQPWLVGIDSLTPPVLYNTVSSAKTYLSLPASAKEICGRKSIFVLTGDPLYFGVFHQKDDSDPEDDSDPAWEKIYEKFKSQDTKEVRSYIGKMAEEDISVLLANVLLVGNAIRLAQLRKGQQGFGRQATPQEVSPAKRGISRRTFLKGMGALAAGAVALEVGRHLPIMLASSSSSGEMANFWKRIIQVTKYRMSHSNWLDGRTAVLAAKTKEAMSLLGLNPGSAAAVLMGYHHAYEGPKLLEDKEVRIKTIRNYAREIIGVMDELAGELSQVGVPKEHAQRVMIEYMTVADIFRVSDPGIKQVAYTTEDMALVRKLGMIEEQPAEALRSRTYRVIDDAVYHVKQFESQEVKEATAGLVPEAPSEESD